MVARVRQSPMITGQVHSGGARPKLGQDVSLQVQCSPGVNFSGGPEPTGRVYEWRPQVRLVRVNKTHKCHQGPDKLPFHFIERNALLELSE